MQQDQAEFQAYRACPEHMSLITGIVAERVADVSYPLRHRLANTRSRLTSGSLYSQMVSFQIQA